MGGTRGVFNALSIVFISLTIMAVIVFGFLLLGPAPADEVAMEPSPTLVQLPTIPPTIFVVSRTPLPPTFTPSFTPTITPSFTPSPTRTNTPAPSFTPSATITDTPPATNTDAPTLPPTLTPTIQGPTATARPPLPFAVIDPVEYTENTFTTAGCDYQAIAGNVVGIAGGPYPVTLRVRVAGGGANLDPVNTGTSADFGVTGFQIPVGNEARIANYSIVLETRNETEVSEPVTIQFPGDCESNIAIVEFVQVREIEDSRLPQEGIAAVPRLSPVHLPDAR